MPEVVLHKRQKGKKEEGKAVAAKLRRGGINCWPPFPASEDEASMKKHKEFIQNEWCRSSPDIAKISKRMDLTFAVRQREMNGKPPLADIKAEYPALFDYDQVQCMKFK